MKLLRRSGFLNLTASYRVRIRIPTYTGRPRGADITSNMAGQDSSADRFTARRLRTERAPYCGVWVALALLAPCLSWIAAIGTGQTFGPAHESD